MNILQVGTLNRPIGRDLGYAPIETVISNIDRGLHDLGHRSIVACSGDSMVAGEHFVTIPRSFPEYHSNDSYLQRANMKRHLIKVWQRVRQGDVDVVHIHDGAMAEYIFNGMLKMNVPIVVTLHVPPTELDSFAVWNRSLVASSKIFFVPISEYQKQQHESSVNLRNVIHHGLDVDGFPFEDTVGEQAYLFSIGRVTPEKGQDLAIAVARRAGLKLIIAGNVQNKPADRSFFEGLQRDIDLSVDHEQDSNDYEYYRTVVRPILDSEKQIVYIGEVSGAQKKIWYRNALATLFPIQWDEPFGLVLIESMACGTPVIALRRGSVPEIVIHRQTGFVVDSVQAMCESVSAVRSIDRSYCRRHVQENFSITSMTEKYVNLYHIILENKVYA